MNMHEKLRLEYSGNIITAYVSDDIDHHRAKGLREEIDARLYADRPEYFKLDMSGVSFMDSSGLGLILGRFTLCRELGIDFALSEPSREVEKILDLAGTSRLIRIEKSENKKKL
jgi:stage II sporulation protein AA (anti-sigma F factor antagonist)